MKSTTCNNSGNNECTYGCNFPKGQFFSPRDFGREEVDRLLCLMGNSTEEVELHDFFLKPQGTHL